MQFPLLSQVATPIKRVSFRNIDPKISETELYKITGLTGKWKIDEKFQPFDETSLDGVIQQLLITEVKHLFTQTQCPHRIYKNDDDTYIVLSQVSDLAEPLTSQQQAFDKLYQWLLEFKPTTMVEITDVSPSVQDEIELSMDDLYYSGDEMLPDLTELYCKSTKNADNADVQCEITQMLCLFLVLPTAIRSKLLPSLNEEAIWQAVVFAELNDFKEYVGKYSLVQHEERMTKQLSKTQLLKLYFEHNTHRFKRNMLDAIELLKFECQVISVVSTINATMLVEYQPQIKVVSKLMLEKLHSVPIISIEEALFTLNHIWQQLEIIENVLIKIHGLLEKFSSQTRFYYKNVLIALFREDEYLAKMYHITLLNGLSPHLGNGSMLSSHQHKLLQSLEAILVPLQDAYDEATLVDRIRAALKILNARLPNLTHAFCALWLPENTETISLDKKRTAYKILHMLASPFDNSLMLQDAALQAGTKIDVCDSYQVDNALKQLDREFVAYSSCQSMVLNLIEALYKGHNINNAIESFTKNYKESLIDFQKQRNTEIIAAQFAELLTPKKHGYSSLVQITLSHWATYINNHPTISNHVLQQFKEILDQLLHAKPASSLRGSDKMVKDRLLEIAKVFLSDQEKHYEEAYANSFDMPIEQKNVMRVQIQAANLCSQLYWLLLHWDEQFGCLSDYQLLGQMVFSLNSIDVSEKTQQLFEKFNARLEQFNNVVELEQLITKLREPCVFRKLTTSQRHYLTVSQQLMHQAPINARDIVTCKLKLSEIIASTNSLGAAYSENGSSLISQRPQSPHAPHSPSRFLRKSFHPSQSSGSPTFFKVKMQPLLKRGKETEGRLDRQYPEDTHQSKISAF